MENIYIYIYVQFDGMVYQTKSRKYQGVFEVQQIVGIPIGSNRAPLIAGVTTNNDPHRKSTPVIFLRRKVTGSPFSTTRRVIFRFVENMSLPPKVDTTSRRKSDPL